MKVSVSVITYNHERYVGDCLDSILSQRTNFPFNVHVSDDCSTDGTLAILRAYAERDPRVVVHSRCGQPKSTFEGRPTGNRNFIETMHRTEGEYVAVCDGDDVWVGAHKLQTQADLLDARPEVALVCSNKDNLEDGVHRPRPGVTRDVTFPGWVMSFFNPIPSSSVMFRRRLLPTPPAWFHDQLDVGDWPVWYLVTRGARIVRMRERFLLYRVHVGGTWGQKKLAQKSMSALRVVRHLRREHPTPALALAEFLQTGRLHLTRLIDWWRR